jgi:hypothetical protein
MQPPKRRERRASEEKSEREFLTQVLGVFLMALVASAVAFASEEVKITPGFLGAVIVLVLFDAYQTLA